MAGRAKRGSSRYERRTGSDDQMGPYVIQLRRKGANANEIARALWLSRTCVRRIMAKEVES